MIFGYGHLNASDRRLKTNIRRVPEQHVATALRRGGAAVLRSHRTEPPRIRLGFVAQDVQAAGKLGKSLCKTMSGEEELLALDYQKLLGGPVKAAW